MWVLVPTDEFLFFARPKKRNQKKSRPDAAYFLRFSHLSGVGKGTPVPLPTHGIPAAPLRAIPNKNASARRDITGNGDNCRL